MTLPPGSTIGIIGGGQLGRMLAIAAARIGYRCHIFDPHERPCAAEVAGRFTRADFDDVAALTNFAAQCDVLTYEFENLPVAPLAAIAHALHPGTRSLEVAQDRAIEKRFIESAGGTVAPWREVSSEVQLAEAVRVLGLPLILKTRRLGYDGKGQAWIRSAEEAVAAWDSIGREPAVAETVIAFQAEFSVILARTAEGESRAFPVSRNEHEGGILRRSSVPAGEMIERLIPAAVHTATALATALDHVGVFTTEFFATVDGPMVNEIAPRVHNSGHWTIEGAHCSQFEQHVRAVCGLPLGDPSLVAGSASMENLIGSEADHWPEYLAEPGAALHLYGKGEARPGRKMGHVTRVG